MNRLARLTALSAMALGIAASPPGTSGGQPDGWVSLFDGRTLTGWRASENPATFRVENGEIVVHGPRAHLFYDGPVLNHEFKDFELRAEVMTRPGANSG